MERILTPMVMNGQEPLGSMGNDVPLSFMSEHSQPVSSYFKQIFAQVTNPALDPIREHRGMSLECSIGKEYDLSECNANGNESEVCERIVLKHPILTGDEFEKIKNIQKYDIFQNYKNQGWRNQVHRSDTIYMSYDKNKGIDGLEIALHEISNRAIETIRRKKTDLIILSHKNVDRDNLQVPSLLAIGMCVLCVLHGVFDWLCCLCIRVLWMVCVCGCVFGFFFWVCNFLWVFAGSCGGLIKQKLKQKMGCFFRI